jgi:splicing factor 3B subunit 5
VGHPTLTSFLAIADGEATGRVKFEMMQVCTAPVCGGWS